MARKKKIVSNPARGFATTSVASKPKPEKDQESASRTPKKDAPPPVTPASTATVDAEPSVAAKAQTPEELEAQLRRDELQLLVEKYAAKIRRESRRQVTRYQTDQRVLRQQSQSMAVHDWLGDDMMERIISLAHVESNDSNRRQGQQPLLRVMSEEDAMAKLWTLDMSLRDMGVSPEYVEPALKWICGNAASIDASAGIWGFQEALEWLALNQTGDSPFSYEEPQPKSSIPDSLPMESDVVQLPAEVDPSDGRKPAAKVKTLVAESPDQLPSDSENRDTAVSDLDSDIEPDQVVPTYLKLKARLFELDPDLVDGKQMKMRSKKKGAAVSESVPKSATGRKLLAQLQQLESDAFFDEYEAAAQWPARRNEIAQAQAAANRENVAPSQSQKKSTAPSAEDDTAAGKKESATAHDDEDGELLGGMFSAVPDEPATSTTNGDADSENITLKDFGKQTGISPRRVLEEAVRARDPGARLMFQLVSPTTYSSRHSLTITWRTPQDLEYEEGMTEVSCRTSKSQALFTAMTVAAVSAEQSEAYISTVALFSLFAASPKEEKVYLRLPPNWRDVYRGLLDRRQERLDSDDRDTIHRLQRMVEDQVEDEESEGVVLTSRFKLRNQASSSTASESGRNTPLPTNDGLIDLWRLKSSAPPYQHMLVGRMGLPVYGFRADILSTIDKNQVTIICGETGCGKSTQIPSFILEHELSQGKPCKIYCTEPRRISAISLAQRVSEELGEKPHDLGSLRSLVGYAIRLETKTSPQTRLIYATVGVLLRMLETSGRLQEVTHLVIDEVHERSIDTDFLLIILRSLMLLRPELKVVLMSATVDADRFSKYLNGAPVLNVPGRTFPVQVQYLEDAIEITHHSASNGEALHDTDTSEDEEIAVKEKSGIPSKLPGYSSATRGVLSRYDEYTIDYELILQLIKTVAYDPQLSSYSNAFLVFMPGIAEIRQLNDMLLGHPSFEQGWIVHPLHSTISSEDQQAAFLLAPPGFRKIVIATNIAETGVTIPDITCVIDTGKHKEMRFDERRQLSRLTQSFISRANAKQRRGRAGRVQEGLCFHLFTKYRHDNLMMDQQTPEMLRLSLQDLVMRTKICKLGDIEKTLGEALDPPSSRNVRRAIDALIEVDALTPGEELTPLGRQIAKLPLDAHLSKLVLLSALYNCVDVAITIAAILSSKSPFHTPFAERQRADIARFGFKKGDSDLLTAYNAYKAWRHVCLTQPRSEFTFCRKNFLSAQNLANIEDLKAQLLSNLADAKFVQLGPSERAALSRYRSTSRHRMFVVVPDQYNSQSENDILVNSVLATALYPKILIREGKGWRNIANNQTVSLAPTSVNKPSSINPSPAKFLSYYHIMQSTNKFYNAHSTSIAYPLPMVLMVGADVDFKLHAGVVGLPGNVLRFTVKDLKAVVALKVLRRRIKEILALAWKNPGRLLSHREREWLDILLRVFEERWKREERARERAAGKGR